MKFYLLAFLAASLAANTQAFSFSWFSSCPSVPVIPNFNILEYTGLWYEIERFPNWFESNLKCVTAIYGLLNSTANQTVISVQNSGVDKSTNQSTIINGNASAPNPSEPNKLIVSFPIQLFGIKLFENNGAYNVLNTDYNNYSLVYSCSELIPYILKTESTWILSRSKTLDPLFIKSIKQLLGSSGINVSKFEVVDQSC